MTNVKSKVNELRKFFELYRAAWSWFQSGPVGAETKVLGSAHGGPVSVVIDGRVFAVSALIPKPEEAAIGFLAVLNTWGQNLRKAFRKGKLHFHAELELLAQPATFESLCKKAGEVDWVVYAKRPFGGPEQVLKYLAR